MVVTVFCVVVVSGFFPAIVFSFVELINVTLSSLDVLTGDILCLLIRPNAIMFPATKMNVRMKIATKILSFFNLI